MFIYAAIATFGFLLLAGMLVLGDVFGGDHEFGADHGGFEHGGADHGDAGGPSIFSVRVMASFLTAFGVGGVIARYYGFSHPAASGIGVASGLVLSGLVYQFAKILYSQQASSEVHMTSLVGRTAEVSVAIAEGGVGQIMITVGGERSEHIARSADGHSVPRGTEVVITGLRGDSVIVARPAAAPGGGTK
jgi:membrane protein implicated in regulation of membrane protease activity